MSFGVNTYGTVYWPDGTTQQITGEDVLWAARMVHYEGAQSDSAHAAAILWTVTARKYYLRSARTLSLSEFMRAFAQPINPKWRRDGEFCRTAPRTGNCSEEKLARRDEAAVAPWESLSELARNTALRWATGTLVNPLPTAVDFAHESVPTSSAVRAIANYRGNVFYTPSGGLPWRPASLYTRGAEVTQWGAGEAVASLLPWGADSLRKLMGRG